MRTPARSGRTPEADRLVRSETAGAASSAAAVFWDVGVVLAVFLGLALTATVVLNALGIN